MNEQEIPEWARPGLLQLVDTLNLQQLRFICQHFPGSFQKVQAMRSRCRQWLESARTLSQPILECLVGRAPVTLFIQQLSDEALTEIRNDLLQYFGWVPVRLALWADSRKLAIDFEDSEQPEEPSAGDRERALKNLADWLDTYFAKSLDLAVVVPENPQTSPKPVTSPNPAQSVPSGAQGGGNEAGGGTGAVPVSSDDVEVWKERLNQAHKKHRQECRELEEARAREQAAHAAAQSELETKIREQKEALLAWEKRFESEVQRRLEEALDSRIRPWWVHAVTEEQVLESHRQDTDGLLEQTARLLQAQEKQDRLRGKRSELRRQLEALRNARVQVYEAVLDSLDPLPELGSLLRRLEAQSSALQKKLGVAGAPDGVLGEIQRSLALADSPEALQTVKSRIEALEALGFIRAEQKAELLALGERRQSLLQDPRVPRRSRRPEAPLFSRVMERGAEGLVLIDLYNFLGRQADKLGLPTGPDNLSVARLQFQPRLRQFATARSHVTFRAFVDGPNANVESLTANVRVEFSGGQGRDRADACLLDYLEQWRLQRRDSSQGVPAFVISDDGEVRRGAQLQGAHVISTEEFARRILADESRRTDV